MLDEDTDYYVTACYDAEELKNLESSKSQTQTVLSDINVPVTNNMNVNIPSYTDRFTVRGKADNCTIVIPKRDNGFSLTFDNTSITNDSSSLISCEEEMDLTITLKGESCKLVVSSMPVIYAPNANVTLVNESDSTISSTE